MRMRDLITIFEQHSEADLWNGKNVVAARHGYRIAVDNVGDAAYVTAWTPDNKRVGVLSTRTTPDNVGRDYLSVSRVEVDPKHRNKGIGLALFRALLDQLAPKWRGIGSYLPDQVNRREVPKIWRRLGGRVHPDNEDHIVADRPHTAIHSQVDLIRLAEAAIPGGETYWFNPSSGEVLTVGDHGEAVMENPYAFGLDAETVRDMIEAFPQGCDEYETPDDEAECDDTPAPPAELLFTGGKWHRNDAWEQLAMNRGWVRCGEAGNSHRYISAATAEGAWAAVRFTLQHHYVAALDIEISGKQASLYASLNEEQQTAFVKAGPRRALAFLQARKG